jgi:hypothetical protein
VKFYRAISEWFPDFETFQQRPTGSKGEPWATQGNCKGPEMLKNLAGVKKPPQLKQSEERQGKIEVRRENGAAAPRILKA